ncbi:MAG: hypothetical protein IT328_26470 [Caldilineaceae bacterium]|nr:hypothetical protein [Caldilineaceae bacterium]
MTTLSMQPNVQLARNQWLLVGLVTVIASVVAVIIAQAAAISLWPEIVRFAPLSNYARTVIFTLVPAVGATALFAWLVARNPKPVQTFVRISVVVLLISFIPDYFLPVPDRTFLASSVAAFLHVIAAVIIVPVIVSGYRRQAK